MASSCTLSVACPPRPFPAVTILFGHMFSSSDWPTYPSPALPAGALPPTLDFPSQRSYFKYFAKPMVLCTCRLIQLCLWSIQRNWIVPLVLYLLVRHQLTQGKCPYFWKTKTWPYFMPYTRIGSRCITDLTVKEQTVKALQNDVEENFMFLG